MEELRRQGNNNQTEVLGGAAGKGGDDYMMGMGKLTFQVERMDDEEEVKKDEASQPGKMSVGGRKQGN